MGSKLVSEASAVVRVSRGGVVAFGRGGVQVAGDVGTGIPFCPAAVTRECVGGPKWHKAAGSDLCQDLGTG